MVRALATAAGLSERAFRRLDDQLVEQLAGRHLLLVLDNCEHVAQAAAVLAERLLKQTRDVTLLATSRERLEVDGEHVWQVRPLPVERSRALRPSGCSWTGPARLTRPPRGRTRTSRRSPRCAPAWTACRWPSSWPPRGCPGPRSASWPGTCGTGSGCLPSDDGPIAAIVRCARSWTGPTSSSPPGSRTCSASLRCSTAASTPLPPARSPTGTTTRPGSPASCCTSSTVPWSPPSWTGARPGTGCWRRCAATAWNGSPSSGRLGEARARHARWAADLVAQAERGLRGADEASWAGTLERHFGDLRAAHSLAVPTMTRARPADGRSAALVRAMALPLRGLPLGRRQHGRRGRVALTVLPEALASAAFGAIYRGDMDAAGTAARAALAAAQGLPPVSARRPLEALAEVATFRGELADAVDLYTRAYDLSIGNGDFLDAAWDAVGAAAAYAYGDRPEEASRLADQARAAADQSRSPSALALVSWVSGEIAAGHQPRPGPAPPAASGRPGHIRGQPLRRRTFARLPGHPGRAARRHRGRARPTTSAPSANGSKQAPGPRCGSPSGPSSNSWRGPAPGTTRPFSTEQ